MLDAITQFERSANFAFAGFILHDAEDVISPMELRLFNYLVERKDLIQIGVSVRTRMDALHQHDLH